MANRKRRRTSLASSPIWPIGSSLSGNLPVKWNAVRWGEVRSGEVRWGEVRWSDVAKWILRFRRILVLNDIRRDLVYIVCYDVIWYVMPCNVYHAILCQIILCFAILWCEKADFSCVIEYWCDAHVELALVLPLWSDALLTSTMNGGISDPWFAFLMAVMKSLLLNFPSEALAWDRALAIWAGRQGAGREVYFSIKKYRNGIWNEWFKLLLWN